MLRGTLICGRDGAVQTRSLCSWPTLVCTVRTLHKTGVPHPCLSPTGTRLMQQEASGRGQWAVCSADVWCPGHGGLSHHRGPLGLGMGSSPGRHRFLSSLLSFLCFPGWHKSPSMLATAPRSQDPILVSPRPPKCCVMPTAQMGLTEPCQAGVSVSGLCQGRRAPLVTQLCRGQVGGTSQGGPSLREGGLCCSFQLLWGALGCCHPQGSFAAQAGSWASHGVGASSWPRGPAPPHSATHPFPGGRGWGAFCGVSPTPLCWRQPSVTPCLGFPRPVGAPSPVGGYKNSTCFQLGAGGGGGPVSLLLEELPAHMLPGALAGRGKRGSKPASGRRRRWKLDPGSADCLIYFKIKQMAAAGVCLSSAPSRAHGQEPRGSCAKNFSMTLVV